MEAPAVQTSLKQTHFPQACGGDIFILFQHLASFLRNPSGTAYCMDPVFVFQDLKGNNRIFRSFFFAIRNILLKSESRRKGQFHAG